MTRQRRFNVSKATIAPSNSILLLVVWRYPADNSFTTPRYLRTMPYPPGPGLPSAEPSENASTTDSGFDIA